MFAIISYAAISISSIEIDFETPIKDRIVERCGTDVNCFSEIDETGGFVRFFTEFEIINGVVDLNSGREIILIEDFPVEIREPTR